MQPGPRFEPAPLEAVSTGATLSSRGPASSPLMGLLLLNLPLFSPDQPEMTGDKGRMQWRWDGRMSLQGSLPWQDRWQAADP